jgi:hypothetical protein
MKNLKRLTFLVLLFNLTLVNASNPQLNFKGDFSQSLPDDCGDIINILNYNIVIDEVTVKDYLELIKSFTITTLSSAHRSILFMDNKSQRIIRIISYANGFSVDRFQNNCNEEEICQWDSVYKPFFNGGFVGGLPGSKTCYKDSYGKRKTEDLKRITSDFFNFLF